MCNYFWQFTVSQTKGRKTSLCKCFAIAHLWPHYVALNLEKMKFSISQEALGLCVLLCLFCSQLLWKITFWCLSLSVLKTTYVSVKFEPLMWVLEIAQSLIMEQLIPSQISLHLILQCYIQIRLPWHLWETANSLSDFSVEWH